MGETDWNPNALRRNAGDENLLVRFDLVPTRDDKASLEAGRPVYKDTEYISIAMPGNRLTRVHRPVRESDKARFSRQYGHWQAQKRNVVDGTPLTEWPPLSRSEVENLAYLNIHTVEQLAGMPDGATQSFLGGHALKQKARDFLARAKDGAHELKLRDELEKRDNETEVLRRQLAEQAALLGQLQAKLSTEEPQKPHKRAG